MLRLSLKISLFYNRNCRFFIIHNFYIFLVLSKEFIFKEIILMMKNIQKNKGNSNVIDVRVFDRKQCNAWIPIKTSITFKWNFKLVLNLCSSQSRLFWCFGLKFINDSLLFGVFDFTKIYSIKLAFESICYFVYKIIFYKMYLFVDLFICWHI